MHNEIQQLMNDLAEGRLDETGRRRLDELCAGDPALARRLRQESNLTALLARCGPNHAPEDLVHSVMTRLDARTPWGYRPPWYAWIFRPAFGTALAFTAMAVIGVQVGLKIHDWRGNGTGAGGRADGVVKVTAIGQANTPEQKIASVPRSAIRKQAGTARKAPANSRPAPVISEKSAIPNPQSASLNPQAAIPDAPAADVRLEEFPTSKPEAQMAAVPRNMGVPPSDSMATGLPAVVSMVPVPISPSVPAQTKPVPRPTVNPAQLADRAIAMEIFLTPTPQATGEAAASPAQPAQPIPYSSSFAPPSASPKAEPVTVKDIEVNLYAVGAEDVSTHPSVGRKNTWEIQATLNPEQFRSFTQQLRGSGVLPGESVLSTGKDGDTTHAPSATTNRYEILHGSQWTQPLERMDAATSASVTRVKTAAPRLSIRITVEQNSGVSAR